MVDTVGAAVGGTGGAQGPKQLWTTVEEHQRRSEARRRCIVGELTDATEEPASGPFFIQ